MAPKSSKRSKRSSTVTVDFTGVQSRQKLPEDDYLVVLDEVNNTESQSGNEQLEFIFKVKEGKYEDNQLWFYCPLTENSLWKLHGLLTAMGVDVPDDEMELDLEDLPGKEVMAVVTHEVYEGTKRSKMTDFYEVEESSSPKKETISKKSKAKEEDEEEEEEKPMTEAEKRKARRDARKLKKAGTTSKTSKKDEEEEEEEEEETPKKGAASKTKAKKMPKLSSDAVQEMDEDDLQETIDEYKLDVDLDDFKTLRKKAAAVVDALETEDMLDE
jgi:hypothetical protein